MQRLYEHLHDRKLRINFFKYNFCSVIAVTIRLKSFQIRTNKPLRIKIYLYIRNYRNFPSRLLSAVASAD